MQVLLAGRTEPAVGGQKSGAQAAGAQERRLAGVAGGGAAAQRADPRGREARDRELLKVRVLAARRGALKRRALALANVKRSALPSMSAAIATPLNSPSAKNRTRVISVIGDKRVGAREGAARGPHWAFRDDGRGTAVDSRCYFDEETELHENWNRYYDPGTGRYLSPEPLLQDPWWIVSMATEGKSPPAYAYALNNPIRYVDRTGMGPGDWDWTQHEPANYEQCIAASKAWLNDYAKKQQDSLNKFLEDLEKKLDRNLCDPQDALNAQKEALEEFNKNMKKMSEWMQNAEKNCKAKFPPQKPASKKNKKK